MIIEPVCEANKAQTNFHTNINNFVNHAAAAAMAAYTCCPPHEFMHTGPTKED
jgi:hypothetical protein